MKYKNVLLNIKAYYISTVIKTVCYQKRDRYVDKGNNREPRNRATQFTQLTFDKSTIKHP